MPRAGSILSFSDPTTENTGYFYKEIGIYSLTSLDTRKSKSKALEYGVGLLTVPTHGRMWKANEGDKFKP